MHAKQNSQPNPNSVSFADKREDNFQPLQIIQKSKILLDKVKEFFLKSISSSLAQEDEMLLKDIKEIFLRNWRRIFRQLENIHTKRALIRSIKSINQLIRVFDYYGACKFKMEIFSLSDVELGIPTGQTYKLNKKEQTGIVLELYQHFFEEVLTQERYSKNYTNEEITNLVQPKIIQRLQKKGILAIASRSDKAGKAYHARMKIVALDLYELDERLDNFSQKNDLLHQSYFQSPKLKYLKLIHNYDQFMKIRRKINETKEKEFIRDFNIHLKRIDSLLLSEFRNNTAADFVNLSKERTYDDIFYKQFFLLARSRTLELKKQSLIDTKNLLVGKIVGIRKFFEDVGIFNELEIKFDRIKKRIQRYQKMPLNRSLFLLRNLVDQFEHVQECYLAANLKLIPFTLHDIELGVQGSDQTYRLDLQEKNSILHKICKTVFDTVVLENSVGKRYINRELVPMVKNLVMHILKSKVPLIFKPFSKEKASYDARFAALDLDSFTLGSFQRKTIDTRVSKSISEIHPMSFIRLMYWQAKDNKETTYMDVVRMYRKHAADFKQLADGQASQYLEKIKENIALFYKKIIPNVFKELSAPKNVSYDSMLGSQSKIQRNKYEILIALCLQNSLKQISHHVNRIRGEKKETKNFAKNSKQHAARNVDSKKAKSENGIKEIKKEKPDKIGEEFISEEKKYLSINENSGLQQKDRNKIIDDKALEKLYDLDFDRVEIAHEFNNLIEGQDGFVLFDQSAFQFLRQHGITFNWQEKNLEDTIAEFKDIVHKYLMAESHLMTKLSTEASVGTETLAENFRFNLEIIYTRLKKARERFQKELGNNKNFWHNSETNAKLNKIIQVIDRMLALHKKIDTHLRKILNLKEKIEGFKLIENLLSKVKEIIAIYPGIALHLEKLVSAHYHENVSEILRDITRFDTFKTSLITSKLNDIRVIWADMQKDEKLEKTVRILQEIVLQPSILADILAIYNLLTEQKKAEGVSTKPVESELKQLLSSGSESEKSVQKESVLKKIKSELSNLKEITSSNASSKKIRPNSRSLLQNFLRQNERVASGSIPKIHKKKENIGLIKSGANELKRLPSSSSESEKFIKEEPVSKEVQPGWIERGRNLLGRSVQATRKGAANMYGSFWK